MRVSLTAILLTIASLQISASSLAQVVTLKKAKMTLSEAFRTIQKQTGYHYFWSAQQVDRNQVVAVDVRDRSLTEAVEQVLDGLPLTYEIDDKVIVIKEKPQPVSAKTVKSTTSAMTKNTEQESIPEVKGRFVDSLGTPLSGVTVSVLGVDDQRLAQTQSNDEGVYVLNNVPWDARLEVRMVGYAPRYIRPRANTGDLVLTAAQETIEELVVVGYTTQRASEVTGSVQSLKGDQIRNSVTTPNALSMLKGKTTGLYITESSGEAGARGQVVQRGQSSLPTPTNSYLGPLIVVDGVITNYTSLQDAVNPADIENLTILKDASSTAIYGSRAAQGVIVITTKRGAAGHSAVDVRAQYGSIQPVRKIRFMNTPEIISFMDQQMTRYWEQTPNMQDQFPDVNDFIDERRTYTDADRNRDFSWEDAIYSSGHFHNTEVGVSHGTEKTKFYAGIGWYKENGALYENSFDRKNLRVNIDHSVSDKLYASINLSSIVDRTSRRNGIPELNMIQPFMHPYGDDGRYQPTSVAYSP